MQYWKYLALNLPTGTITGRYSLAAAAAVDRGLPFRSNSMASAEKFEVDDFTILGSGGIRSIESPPDVDVSGCICAL